MAELAGVFAVSHTPVMTNMPHAPAGEISGAVYDDFRRIGAEIAALDPDLLLLVSNDHLHNFFLDNLPAFCVGAADRYDSPVEGWLKVEKRVIPGDTAFGAYLVQAAFDAGFDPAFSMELTLDHGMVTPMELAGVAGRYKCVPVLINCVQPPLPRMDRCLAFGRMIGAAIAAYGGARRVVVLATGGLSHDVGTPRMGELNEVFDRTFLDLLAAGDAERLTAYAAAEVNHAGNGGEEVRNWLLAHGIAGCSGFELYSYRPVTEWYTGIGIGRWRVA